ncbi:MAG: hypothetical protein ACTS45_01460 [Candidatus Hodgkinia cicadicola]
MDSAVGRPQGFKVNQMAVLANGGVLVQSWEPKRRRTFVMFRGSPRECPPSKSMATKGTSAEQRGSDQSWEL